MTALQTRHLVIDDFLPDQEATGLLEQMLAAQLNFTPSTVTESGEAKQDNAFRSSLRLPGRVGVNLDGLRTAVHAGFAELCDALGLQPFDIDHTECSIVAHGEGDFYKRHIDTGTPSRGHVRVISCVYYLHGQPKNFGGGELTIYPVAGDGEPTIIEPIHNRLAIFPSFVPHEVLPTSGTGKFEDSRFSVNVWLHKAVVHNGDTK